MNDRPANRFRILVRHSFDRFFDREDFSPQGDPQASLAQLLGIAATPGAILSILLQTLTLVRWDLVYFRYFFVSFSMIVMAGIVVFRWDALFPDRRDYQILGPLPVPLLQLFLAKAVALGSLLGVFLIALNLFSVLFWPGIDGGRDLHAILGTHAVVLFAAGLFTALATASIRGLLVLVFSGRMLRRVAVGFQTILIAGLVALFFLTSLLASSMRALTHFHSIWLYIFPPYWFVGLYERLRPATNDPTLMALGDWALAALGMSVLTFVLTFFPWYRRHARRTLETPEPSPSGPGFFGAFAGRILDRTFLTVPVQRAIFRFISQTIVRSLKHRLFLAVYGGFGIALAVLNLSGGGTEELSLTLSFILVSGLRAAFNFPSELEANWAFRVSDADVGRDGLEATRKWIGLMAIMPLFACLAPLEFLWFSWTVALFHITYGILLSLGLVEILFAAFRKIPFTCSYFPGKVNLIGLGVIYIFGFTTYSARMAQVERWLSAHPAVAAAFVVCSLAVLWVLPRLRVQQRQTLAFEDTSDPIVRTLGVAAQ